MSGHLLHGFQHGSPSSYNMWAAAPALWGMERLARKRGGSKCALHRGTAVEMGVVAGLLDQAMSLEDAQQIAVAKFDALTALSGDPKREVERAGVPGMVEQGLLALRPYGVPDEIQMKVSHSVEGLNVPILGYLDIGWSRWRIRVDIKTTHKLHQDMVEAHGRQVALYVHDTTYQARVAYLTPKKHGVYPLENAEDNFHALAEIGRRLDRFLSISSKPEDLLALLTPDYSSFYWNDPVTRALGRETYGF